MITDINSEDRLVQQTFAEHLEKVLGWDCITSAGERALRAGAASANGKKLKWPTAGPGSS